MGKSEYTLEEVKHIIDLTWGFAYEDWQVPGYDLYDYILHLQQQGKTNGDMKKEGDANLGYHKFHNPDSQSPATAKFYTLQNGDWFQGTEEQYRKVLQMEYHPQHSELFISWANQMVASGYCIFSSQGLYWDISDSKQTQLTPEEFLRRAENTFNKK